MELRSVEELMDLLYACRGSWADPGPGKGRVDLHQHALQTAASWSWSSHGTPVSGLSTDGPS